MDSLGLRERGHAIACPRQAISLRPGRARLFHALRLPARQTLRIGFASGEDAKIQEEGSVGREGAVIGYPLENLCVLCVKIGLRQGVEFSALSP